jgi:hypothetical protein
MRSWKSLLFLSCSVIFLLLPALSSSEVKITLTNGRTIIADFCRESKGKLLCDMSGGTVEFDKQEIESIKEVTIQRRPGPAVDIQPEASNGEPEKKEDVEKKAADVKTPVEVGNERVVRGLNPEQAKQLDMINEKKTAMKAERERLIKEREQLHEDVKSAGVVRNQEQFDALKKRISDLEARINGFNEEVKRISEEESRLIEGSK